MASTETASLTPQTALSTGAPDQKLDIDERSSALNELPPTSRGPSNEEKVYIDVSEPSNQPQAQADTSNRPVGFAELFRYSTKVELLFDAIALVCAAASGAAQPLLTLIYGNLTNTFVNFSRAVSTGESTEGAAADFRHAAAQDALYLVFLGIGTYVVTHTYMYVWTWTAETNSKRIRERYFRSILRQDVAFFDTLGAGEVATRIQSDTHLIQLGISEKVPILISCFGAFITGFALAYARSWRLALAVSSILPCIVITGAAMNVFERKYKALSLQSIAEGGTLAEEVFSTIRTGQAFGIQNTLSLKYDGHVVSAHAAECKAAILQGIGMGILFFIIYGSYGLAFYYGTTLILDGRADAGVVVNVFMSILIGAFSLALVAPEAAAIAAAQAAAAKIFVTIDRTPPIDAASEAGLKPPSVKGTIQFDAVDFYYPSRTGVPVLKHFSITFEAGKTAALVGASGSGKSTVVALVERFYDPVGGVVRLDGNDVKDLNIRWLRQHIGLVQQEPSLFGTTVAGNVAHGLIGTKWETAPEPDKFKLIKEACIRANADEFIERLPLGYDTLVGERGFLLSGGQKQRIAIARAIVSDPAILLLDEATSSLDSQSEGIVQDALNKAAAGRTTIVIAHRLSTVRDADCIYVMGGGEILESGTHNELLSDEAGAYAQLVKAQELKADGGGGAPEQHIKLLPVPLQLVYEDGGAAYVVDEAADRKISLMYLLKRMRDISRHDYKLYIFGVFLSILANMVYPSFGIVFAKSISAFSLTDRHQLRFQGDRNALWLFLIAIAACVVVAGQTYLYSHAAAGLTAKLRTLIFRAVVRQETSWFDRKDNATGKLVAMLSDNPTKISSFAGVTLGAIVQSLATVVGGSIIGLIFGAKLSAVAIACTPFVFLAGYIRLRVVVLKDQESKTAHEDSAQLACEAAGAVRTVQSLTREDECFAEYSRSLDAPLKHSQLFSTGLFAVSQALSFMIIALVFWYGSRLVASREYSTFQFFVVMMSVTFSAIQVGNIFSFVPDMSAAKGAANDIIQLLDLVPAIDSESPDGTKADPEGRISLENVRFSYPTRPDAPVLRGLDLVVEPGTYVALVGASGCGKSTVIQLIERFYDPTAGRVLVDRVDVSTLNVQDHRKHMALVSQEPTLYAGTIRFNILLGASTSTSEEELEKACADANILEFIRTLPLGFDTEVGGKGAQLSGGQKQRIAIARALLRDPKILLLDEATSALDSQSERVVQASLDRASRGRTTIAIAHRLSTIQKADRIHFLKDGRVTESGTHEELLRLGGDYCELVRSQALSKL